MEPSISTIFDQWARNSALSPTDTTDTIFKTESSYDCKGQNVDVLANVYLSSALKSNPVKPYVKYIYRSKWGDLFFTGKSIVLYCSGWSK